VFGESQNAWRMERDQRLVPPACLRSLQLHVYRLAGTRSLNNGGPPV
jgi:hypothetical protein